MLIFSCLQAIFRHFSVTSVTCFCKFPYRNYLPRTKCISIVEVCSARYTRYTNIIYIIFEVLAKRNKRRGAAVLNLTYFTIGNKLKNYFFNLFMNHNQVDYSSLPSYFSPIFHIDTLFRGAFDRAALEVKSHLGRCLKIHCFYSIGILNGNYIFEIAPRVFFLVAL